MLARPLARPLIGRAVWRRRLFISRSPSGGSRQHALSAWSPCPGRRECGSCGLGTCVVLLAWLVRIWYEHTVRFRSWVRVSPTCSRGWSWYTVPECWAARLDGSAVLWVGDRAYLADWRRCIDRIVVDAGTGSHATDGKVRSDRPSNPLLTMHPSLRLPVVDYCCSSFVSRLGGGRTGQVYRGLAVPVLVGLFSSPSSIKTVHHSNSLHFDIRFTARKF
jgi:hypothetical protein